MNNEPKKPIDTERDRRISGYFSRLGFALLLMTVANFAVQYLAVWLIKSYAPELISQEWVIMALTFLPLYLVGVPMFVAVARKVPRVETERKKMSVGAWFTALLMCFGILYVGNYLGQMLMATINSVTGNDATSSIGELLTTGNPIIVAIVTVIVAPVVEELIFRRMLIDRTRHYGEWCAIVFSALMFGLFHGNLYQFFYAFGVGLLFAFIYVRTGRAWYTVLLHMAVNFFGGVVGPFIQRRINAEELALLFERVNNAMKAGEQIDMSLYEGISESTLMWAMLSGLYSLVFSVAAIAGLVLLFVKRKKFRLERAEFELPRERVGAVVYFNAGVFSAIIVCVVRMVLALA